ncbi:hypothetical protein FRB93_012753 [Tulasnella sp. JGI-2019a]|nr:hypothetical protein FRB93_012753 [Tulasnella sp. JGI-2019a]
MAAYYQQPRQRAPLPRESQLEDSRSLGASSLTPHEVQQLESYLIFPEPTSAAAPNRITTGTKLTAVESEANAPAQLSPTPSSLFSVQTSLLASIAQRSRSRDLAFADLTHRSASREYEYAPSTSSSLSEWEELKGPLPQPPSNLLLSPARGRRGRTRPSPTRSPIGLGEEADGSAQIAGIGWDWTLDREAEAEMAIGGPPDDLLLGLRWTTARSSAGREEGSLSKGDAETWYEDALSHWQPSHVGGPINEDDILVYPGQPLGTERSTTTTTASRYPTAELQQFRNSIQSYGQMTHRRRSRTFRPTSPTRHRQRSRPPNSIAAISALDEPSSPAIPSIFSSPFRTFLQAFFAIDQSTLDLIDNYPTSENGDVKPQSTTIFDLQDDIVKGEETEQTTRRDSHLGLLNPPEDSAQTTDRILKKGFMATDLVTHTNPFALPFLLLEMGWEYGVRSLVTISSVRGNRGGDQKEVLEF